MEYTGGYGKQVNIWVLNTWIIMSLSRLSSQHFFSPKLVTLGHFWVRNTWPFDQISATFDAFKVSMHLHSSGIIMQFVVCLLTDT